MGINNKIRVNLLVLVCLCIIAYGGLAHAQYERWVYTYDGPGLISARAKGIAYGNGDLYASGYLNRTNTYWDFAAVSVDYSGKQRWTYSLDGLGPYSMDEATSVALGADTNVYVAGYLFPMGSYLTDFIVVSLNQYGAYRWMYTYNGTGNNNDRANAIVSSSLVTSAAGYSMQSGTGLDFTIISLMNTNGSLFSVYTYNGAGNGADEAYAITHGTNFKIYAAGYCTGSSGTKDFAVISSDIAGNHRWAYTYDGNASGHDEAFAIVYGADDHVYAAGYSRESGNDKDLIVVKLDTLGNEKWVHIITTTNSEEACAIAYGADDNIYVAGYRNILMQSNNFLVVSIDTAGNERWAYTYNGPVDNADDKINAIVYGTDNNIYAAGYSTQSTANKDLTVLALDTLKNEVWFYTYNGSLNTHDMANSIIYGDDGNIYVAGVSDTIEFTMISIDPRFYPEAWISPSFFYVIVDSGETKERTLNIASIGQGSLEWNISTTQGSDWFCWDDSSGLLDPGDTATINLTFDGNIVPDHYYDTLIVSINNPYNPLISVPVHFWVREVGCIEEYPTTTVNRCELISSFFNKSISLRFSNPSKTPCQIVLYNALGSKVYEASFTSTTSLLKMDNKNIQRLSKGIYFLYVSQNEKTYPVMKLIKY